MPPAAAAPPRSRVGKVQNRAGDTIRPAAATHSAISATSGDGVSAETASAMPAMPARQGADAARIAVAVAPGRNDGHRDQGADPGQGGDQAHFQPDAGAQQLARPGVGR